MALGYEAPELSKEQIEDYRKLFQQFKELADRD